MFILTSFQFADKSLKKEQSSDSHVIPKHQNTSSDKETVEVHVCGSATANAQAGQFSFIKGCTVANSNTVMKSNFMPNKTADDIGINDDTLGNVVQNVKGEKLQKTGKNRNDTPLNSVDCILEHSNASGSKLIGVPQGAGLPPSLFPPVFHGTMFNPLFSRSPFVNDTTSLFRHPFGMLTQEIPFRFPAYYSHMATQSLYRYGGQSTGYQMPTTSDTNNDDENDVKGPA